jgi:nucleotide-binding universal stress UspA family protein
MKTSPDAPADESAFALEHILVPLDATDDSLHALESAVPLAKRFAARIHLVYVGEEYFSEITLTPHTTTEAEIGARMKERVESRFPVEIRIQDCYVRHGRPFHEISDLAVQLGAGLIVLATHGRRGIEHIMRGSTAEKVVRHSRTPVLVVRGDTKPEIDPATGQIQVQRILVPVDLSECAQKAASYAAQFGAKLGADLLLLHVLEAQTVVPNALEVATADWPQVEERALAAAEEKLGAFADSLPLIGINAESAVEVGIPAEVLVAETETGDIDLVITSTHGHTGLKHVLLGSTAEKLVRLAACPVLVVPSHSA